MAVFLSGRGKMETPVKHDENTVLLLHGDSLKDSSQYDRVIENYGVVVSAAQSIFGGKSLLIQSGKYMLISPHNFGSGDFTIDWWEYVLSSNSGARFCTAYGTQTTSGGIVPGFQDSGSRIYISSGVSGSWDVLSYASCFKTNYHTPEKWVHRAIVRTGSTLTIYTDGVKDNSYNIGTKAIGYSDNHKLCIGRWASDFTAEKGLYNGYIEEFRISNIARWTAPFSPPGEPYEG